MTAPAGVPGADGRGSGDGGRLSGRGRWALAFRLARREVRAHPWRHALVVALIFVPTAAAFAGHSAIQTWDRTEARKAMYRTAGAAVALRSVGGGFGDETGSTSLDVARLRAAVAATAPGSSVEGSWEGADWAVPSGRTGVGRELVGVTVLESPDGARSAARWAIVDGRLPRTSAEILVTPPLAEDTGWQVGDEVELARSRTRFRVVGIGVLGATTGARAVAVAEQPADYWSRDLGPGFQIVRQDGPQTFTVLPPRAFRRAFVWTDDGQVSSALEARLAGPLDWLGPTVDREPVVTLAGGEVGQLSPLLSAFSAALAGLVAVVASTAFAVGARRQLRSVGLLATAGADPATVRAALVLQGALPGAIAALGAIGVVSALAVAGSDLGWAERLYQLHEARFSLSLGGALVSGGVAVGAGVLAAWHPARTVVRVPILSALAGRRPLGPLPTRIPLAGVALIATGVGGVGLLTSWLADGPRGTPVLVGLGYLAAIGGIGVGGVAVAPALVALAGRAASRTGGRLRLALRSLDRQRMQSAATVAGIAVVLALPVALITVEAQGAELDRARSAPDEIAPRPLEAAGTVGIVVETTGDPRATEVRKGLDRAEALLGVGTSSRSARLTTTAFADGRGGWVTVTTIDRNAARRVLQPWAAAAVSGGRALALGGRHDASVILEADRRIEVATSVPPDRTPVHVPGAGGDYLVAEDVVAGVAPGRPALSVAILSVERPSPALRRELAGLAPALRPWNRPPTLAEVRRAVAQAGTAPPAAPGADDLGPTAAVDELQVWDLSPHAAARPSLLREPATLGLAAAVLLAVAVMTITLVLRSVDGADDDRVALAVGAPPSAMRRQRALEGIVLALLGSSLALPVGWLPATAIGVGRTRGEGADGLDVAAYLASPGLRGAFVLLTPVVVVAVLWTVVPDLRAGIRSLLGRPPADVQLARG